MNEKLLQSTLFRLLKPLVRVLLRQGMSFDEFAEVGRHAFIDVADQEFRIPGRKQTISRISMLTGVQRKEVSRLRGSNAGDGLELDSNYNRGVRITSGWRRDPSFCNELSEPMPLAIEGDNSFAMLVRRYSGDIPYRAVLDEFLRVGVVAINESNQVVLSNAAGYVPTASEQDQLNIMGQATSDLLKTLAHNLDDANRDKRLQLTVAYNNVSRSTVKAFDALSRRDGFKLLQKFDQWLAERDRDANPSAPQEDDERCRVGVGIYFFEDTDHETETKA